MKNKFIFILVIFFVFIMGVTVSVFQMFHGKNKMYYTAANDSATVSNSVSKDAYNPKFIFAAVKMIIDKNYVEKIDANLSNEMSVDLAKGMLRELGDSSCRYVDKKEMELIEKAGNGEFQGLGIKTDIRPIDVNGISEEKLYVTSVIAQGPAYKAGIKAGDMIELVNDKEILPYNPLARAEKILKEYQIKPDKSRLKEVQAQLDKENERIEKGITILEAERMVSYDSEKTVKIKTDRAVYNLKPESWKLAPVKQNVYNNVPYLQVQCLTDTTGEELGKYIQTYIKNKRTFFVLDLRDVFGGTYDSAKEVAKWFVPGINMGILQTKKTSINLEIPKNKIYWQGKLVILVNKGTDKYGELLANIISQDRLSIIVGEETLGDFKDISIYDFDNGGGFTLTTGEYIPRNRVKNVVPKIKVKCGPVGKEIDKSVIVKALNMVGGNK